MGCGLELYTNMENNLRLLMFLVEFGPDFEKSHKNVKF